MGSLEWALSILCEIFDASLKISLKREQLFGFHNFLICDMINKNNFNVISGIRIF